MRLSERKNHFYSFKINVHSTIWTRMENNSHQSEYKVRHFGHQYYAVFSGKQRVFHFNRRVYTFSFPANMITFSFGSFIGWVASAIAHLMSAESSLGSGPITVEEASWIGSIICLGGILGAFLFGCVCAITGSKRALCLIAIPAVLHWLMIIFGKTVVSLYIARILAGCVGGAIQQCGLIYVAEITDSR